MKRAKYFIILSLIFMFTLMSCTQEISNEYGELRIDIKAEDFKSKTIMPAKTDDLKVLSYTLRAYHENGRDYKEETTQGTSFNIGEMLVGQWNIVVSGYTKEGIKIAESAPTRVSVSVMENNYEHISVPYIVDGESGSFNIAIKWRSAFEVVEGLKIEVIKGGNSIRVFNIDADEATREGIYNTLSVKGFLPSGSYQIKVSAYDESKAQIGFSEYESLNIFPTFLSKGTLEILDDYSQLDKPKYEVKDSKSVLGGIEITLTADDSSAKLYFTEDGATPTSDTQNLYRGTPIKILPTDEKYTHIKAIAVREGFKQSEILHLLVTNYFVGDVFYDCDADNTLEDTDGVDNLNSETCGWRFIEAAPYDLRLIQNDKPSIEGNTDDYISGEKEFIFGYYTDTENSTIKPIETSDGIGYGKTNTDKAVEKMGSNAYGLDGIEALYAAKLCQSLAYKKCTNWHLPSFEELRAYLNSANANNISSNAYWTSSESSDNSGTEVRVLQGTDPTNVYSTLDKTESLLIRPVRYVEEMKVSEL